MRKPAFAAVLTAAALCVACGEEEDPEVMRVPGPNGKLDVVVLEWSPGAMASYTHTVCLVRAGERCSNDDVTVRFYAAVRSESAYGVTPVWTSQTEVEVRYLAARQKQVVSTSKTIDGETVVVTLKDGIDHPGAPSGSMRNVR
jgi:hypothetical protein